MNSTVLQYSQFVSGCILLLFSLIQLVYRKKSFINYNLAGLYFCLSFLIIYRWLFSTGLILNCRYLLNYDVAITYLIGPFVLFYLRALTGLADPAKKYVVLNFIPFVLVVLILTWMNVMDASYINFYNSSKSVIPIYNITTELSIIELCSNSLMIIYFIIGIIDVVALMRIKNRKPIREVIILLIYMLLVTVASAGMIAGDIVGSAIMVASAVYILTALGIWYFFFSFRFPEFTQKAVREARLVRSDSVTIDLNDANAVLARLDVLMSVDKIYVDDELSLDKTAELLGITPHQLSRYVNEKMGLNFRGYINAYRIRDAKKILLDCPEKSVLEIAFMTGFNSKSSFNSVFMKSEGITPSEYRSKFVS